MNKKAIAILGAIFVLIVGTLGFLIYLKYAGSAKKTPATVAQNPTSTSTPQTQPPVATTTPATPVVPAGSVVQLTTDQVVSPTIFYNGNSISYFDNQGNFYQAALLAANNQLSLSNKKQIDIPAKSAITKILWPKAARILSPK